MVRRVPNDARHHTLTIGARVVGIATRAEHDVSKEKGAHEV